MAGEKALTVRIAPEVYERLQHLAKREKRSVSAQAAYLIENGLRLHTAVLQSGAVPGHATNGVGGSKV